MGTEIKNGRFHQKTRKYLQCLLEVARVWRARADGETIDGTDFGAVVVAKVAEADDVSFAVNTAVEVITARSSDRVHLAVLNVVQLWFHLRNVEDDVVLRLFQQPYEQVAEDANALADAGVADKDDSAARLLLGHDLVVHVVVEVAHMERVDSLRQPLEGRR